MNKTSHAFITFYYTFIDFRIEQYKLLFESNAVLTGFGQVLNDLTCTF